MGCKQEELVVDLLWREIVVIAFNGVECLTGRSYVMLC